MDTDFQPAVDGELTLLDPGVRADRDAAGALLHKDFSEFGASGTVWDRESVLRMLSTEATERIVAERLETLRLGPDAVLLTYVAVAGERRSLRTSIWVREDGTWLMRHHQGTSLR
ncbi:nuclear transport factor 2 family protein [Amycolatopsis sp. CA-230715]|uniref:nuclear transport factor 2 family protein n=1 Tax=Amycolatopsis sp. CA-230715 TaxID=2745196 RepID=UPI001C0129ED|nr:nuclear transport factor 2 family protein [Amycolatopsis sp. CA-230715]QWF78302.1 hypothetical protein HUW46_01697 [Amycolatopsis sp. CA-230715]